MKPITEDDLHAYVDEALDEQRREQVESYLQSNREAMARVTAYRNQSSALRSALDPIAKEPIPVRLNLRHMMPNARENSGTPKWRYAAAAVVFLVVGAGGGWISRGIYSGPTEGVAALAAEATASYRTFAADKVRPVEVRVADGEALREMTRATIGMSDAVPDLTTIGYRLMGGRTVPTVHGPAVMLMYDDDKGSRLVMLGRKMAADKESTMKDNLQDGLGSWTWARNGIGFSLVGSKPMPELRAIADRAKDEIAL